MPIDYILAFASQAAAQVDPVVGAWWATPSAQSPGGWIGNVIPGIAVTVNGTGGVIEVTDQNGVVTSQPGPDAPYDAQWRIAIATPARVPALDAHPALEIVADRGLALAGAPLASYILSSNVPLAALTALAVSPQFAGSNYVYGAR